MQAIETYTPSLSNLHLTPFQSVNTIADDIHPFNYRLTTDNFISLTLPDGQLLYALDPATGTSLWWALRRIARVITRAAVHSLPIDPSFPVSQRAYIPQFQFDRIAMQRPTILSTLDSNCMNPLYGYTSRENIQAWYTNFENMGRQAVQWIRTARIQSTYLGPYSGWNWDTLYNEVSSLGYPNRYLIKGPEGMYLLRQKSFLQLTRTTERLGPVSYVLPSQYSPTVSDLSSEHSISSIVYDEDVVMKDTENSKLASHQIGRLKLTDLSDNRGIVLHPSLSAYAKRYPGYNVFSKEPLIDNGYVEREAGDFTPYASALSPINSTAFTILSLPDVRAD